MDWALERIAQLVKHTRDDGLVETDESGMTVNHVKNMALIGGSAADTEEIYLATKLMGPTRWGSCTRPAPRRDRK